MVVQSKILCSNQLHLSNVKIHVKRRISMSLVYATHTYVYIYIYMHFPGYNLSNIRKICSFPEQIFRILFH